MKSRFARRSVLSLALVLGLSSLAHADVTLLNVSYDPTRELSPWAFSPPFSSVCWSASSPAS